MYRKRAFHLWDKEKRSQLTSASTHGEYQRRSHSLGKVCAEHSEKKCWLSLFRAKPGMYSIAWGRTASLGIVCSHKNLCYEPRKIEAGNICNSRAVAHTNQDMSRAEPSEELAARQESRALCVNYIIAGSGCEAPAQGEWSYFLCRALRSPFSCPARIEKPGQGEFLPERLFWRKQMCMLNLESTIKSTRLPSAIIFSTLRGCEISAKSQLHRPTAPQRMLGRCFVGAAAAAGWAAAAHRPHANRCLQHLPRPSRAEPGSSRQGRARSRAHLGQGTGWAAEAEALPWLRALAAGREGGLGTAGAGGGSSSGTAPLYDILVRSVPWQAGRPCSQHRFTAGP